MKRCYKILVGVLAALALCGCGVKESSESVDVVIQEAVPVVEEEVQVEAEEPEETTAVEETEELLEECQFDSNDDIRKMVAKRLKE